METVLITGGTGLIGQELATLLTSRQYQVIILTQHPQSIDKHRIPGVKYAVWNVKDQTIDSSVFHDCDHIIHLAGEGIADKRWTKKRKAAIASSRVEGSDFVVKMLKDYPNKVRTVVSASAIGWYGEDKKGANPKAFSESDPHDPGFLGETCRLWEEHIAPVTEMGKRLVIFRTGIALSTKGGALKEFLRPIRFGVAAILGIGKQVISWIHIDDLCRMYLDAIENTGQKGVYNAVAPKPVTNRELTLLLAQRVKKRFFVPLYIPAFLLKIVIGELSTEVLKSTTVSCEKIRMAGFSFIYPSVESAIGELIKNNH